MKQLRVVVAIAACALVACAGPNEKVSGSSIDQDVEALMEQLTEEEKVALLVGAGIPHIGLEGANRSVPGAGGLTRAVAEKGVDTLAFADGPAGVRLNSSTSGGAPPAYATAFPIGTALSSSFDVELIQNVGAAIGREARAYDIDIILAPGLNLQRDPLGGRNFEYFSEDPLVTGKIAAAYVRGVQSEGVGATLKHFVANNQETNRTSLDVRVADDVLRSMYLRGFEIAVREAHPWAVMASFNKVNDASMSENEELLRGVLREEWGFDGLVLTDWFAAGDPRDQVRAGVNLLMPGTPDQLASLREALEDGRLTSDALDTGVRPILRTILKAGVADEEHGAVDPGLGKHAALARRAAGESTVLLKNEDVLPLKAWQTSAALFGNNSYRTVSGGTGSGDVNEKETVNIVDGFLHRKAKVDAALGSIYTEHLIQETAARPPRGFFDRAQRISEPALARDIIARAARENDFAVYTIGRNSGEFYDRELNGDFYLDDVERQTIATISHEFRALEKPFIIVMNIGGVIETATWRDEADAIILPWQGGQYAGNAVCDVLFGEVSPAGRLPVTFPLSYDDTPTSKTFPGTVTSGEPNPVSGTPLTTQEMTADYREGFLVGYRYYETEGVDVAYPFGFGLSYTEFEIDVADQISRDGGYSKVLVDVKNSGAVPGKETVFAFARWSDPEPERPASALVAFAKTKTLSPGETQRIELTLDQSQLDPNSSNTPTIVVSNEKGAAISLLN